MCYRDEIKLFTIIIVLLINISICFAILTLIVFKLGKCLEIRRDSRFTAFPWAANLNAKAEV